MGHLNTKGCHGRFFIKSQKHKAVFKADFVCILLGALTKSPVNPCYEPLSWFTINTIHGNILEWEKFANLANRAPFAKFLPAKYVFLFAISCNYACSSFTNILPSNWFRLAHLPIYYPTKTFPCTVWYSQF